MEGLGPHETIVSLNGKHVYLSGVNWPWLEVASTATDRVIKRIGPLRAGVRPTTINGRETIAYTTASGYLGFQVSSITTGRVLFTVGFGPRFPAIVQTLTPSHGISLTLNERQLWVMDSPNGYVHVFDVSGVPQRRPTRIADIRLVHALAGGSGWIQMGSDGCFVYWGFGRGDQHDQLQAGRFPAGAPQHQGVARDRLALRPAGGDEHAYRTGTRDREGLTRPLRNAGDRARAEALFQDHPPTRRGAGHDAPAREGHADGGDQSDEMSTRAPYKC